MGASIGFRYDEASRTILVESPDALVELYSDASLEEFEIVKTVDGLVTRATALHDKLLYSMEQRRALVQEQEYFDFLNDLQQETADRYQQCIELQADLQDSESRIVAAQMGQLYKTEKLLKHYFRCLSVGQSLGFSERLLLNYLATQDPILLYGSVRNACSTIEYLGVLIENRIGDGQFELEDTSLNCVTVYEELKRQNLDSILNEDQCAVIPPTGETVRMGDIALDTTSIEFLWDKRNMIVHRCPLVVREKNADHLPEELLSTCILAESDIAKLTSTTTRLHLHSIGMFLNFSKNYLESLISELIDAWYLDQ